MTARPAARGTGRAPARRAPAAAAAATKAPTGRAPATKTPARRAPATKTPARRAPATKTPARRAPRAKPARRAVAKAIEQEAGHIGPVRVPSPDRLAFYGGIAALALFGIVDWPVALVIGVGHLLADDHHHKLLADFGEALGEA